MFIRDARPAPPREMDKTRRAQRGKTDCKFHWWPLFITATLEKERVRKAFHLTLCTDCDHLVHGNAFSNILMHYKYPKNNLRTFVFWISWFTRLFALPRGFSSSPRPARPSLMFMKSCDHKALYVHCTEWEISDEDRCQSNPNRSKLVAFLTLALVGFGGCGRPPLVVWDKTCTQVFNVHSQTPKSVSLDYLCSISETAAQMKFDTPSMMFLIHPPCGGILYFCLRLLWWCGSNIKSPQNFLYIH